MIAQEKFNYVKPTLLESGMTESQYEEWRTNYEIKHSFDDPDIKDMCSDGVKYFMNLIINRTGGKKL